MPDWNPGAPGILGPEWFPTLHLPVNVQGAGGRLAQRIRSTGAETIGAARLAIASNPLETDPLVSLLDIIPAGSEKPTVNFVDYAPNAQGGIGSWTDQGGGTANIWQAIDEAVVIQTDPTHIESADSNFTNADFDVASAAFPQARRVCRLTTRAVIGLSGGVQARLIQFLLFHVPSGTQYLSTHGTVFTATIYPTIVEVIWGEINPQTLLPWSPNDVRDFDAGVWRLRVRGNGNVNTQAAVAAMALRVHYTDPENRAAVGVWSRTNPPPAVFETDDLVSLSAGAWAANWAKPASGDFSCLLRGAEAHTIYTNPNNIAADIAWRTAYQHLGPGGNPPDISFPPLPGWEAATFTVDAFGIPTTTWPTSPLAHTGRIVLRTTAPADSVDSQPYYLDDTTTVRRALTSAQPIAQRVTTGGAPNNYLGVRAVVIPGNTGTLTIGVYRQSDNAKFGGDLLFTAAQVAALPEIPGSGGARYLEGFLSTAAALAASTQYEIRATVDAGSWVMIAPNAVGAGGVSFGGTTDCLEVNAVAQTEQDTLLAILIQPTAPANFRATVEKVDYQGGGTQCTAEATDQITLSWSATALAGSWDRYELQRLEDDGSGVDNWQTVHTITSAEALTHWTDRETRRGYPVRYRIRVVATTTAFSDWAYSGWVTAEPYGTSMVFTSNQRPDLTVAVDYEPTRDFDFLDHDADELVPIYGADYQVAFMEPEDRGVTKQVRLIVQAVNVPCDNLGHAVPDDLVFEPLRRISRAADIPYVCVLDARGNRAYAHVTLSSGRAVVDSDGSLNFYWCTALITPITGVPAAGVG